MPTGDLPWPNINPNYLNPVWNNPNPAPLRNDAGYMFAPYVPLLTTPPVLDPNSFNQNRDLITRYSEEALRDSARYYSNIVVMRPEYEEKEERVNWREEGF
jgi:hypothetical protein